MFYFFKGAKVMKKSKAENLETPLLRRGWGWENG